MRVPERQNVGSGTPHVTWVLMFGDRDNPDREFACQSDPRTECVVPPSRPDDQVFSDIHFYFHAAGADTRYEGTKAIGYLQGSSSAQTSRTAVTVTKDERIAHESVTGLVTSTPGTYTVTVSVTATIAGASQPVRETIQVVVK
jgi:hypothetical protein